MDKIRLDKALLKTISSRAKAQDMIKEGKVRVNKKVITKASFLVSDEDDIVVHIPRMNLCLVVLLN